MPSPQATLRHCAAAVLLVTGAGCPTGALATEPRLLSQQAGHEWKHRESGVRLPGQLAGATLESVADSTDSESDVTATYQDRSAGLTISVFLFRAGVPDASLWLDRSLAPHRSGPQAIGKIDFASEIFATVTPPSGATDSAVYAVYPASGGPAASTAFGMVSAGEWLIGLRLSSRALSLTDLRAKVDATIRGLKLPRLGDAGPAYAVADCPDHLSTADAPRTADGDDDGMTSLILQLAVEDAGRESKKTAVAPTAARFCREAAINASVSAYRLIGTRDSYVIATGDAGVTITVGPSLMSALEPGKPPRYDLSLVTVDRQLAYRGFTAVPSVLQAIRIVNGEMPVGSKGRTPATRKNLNIDIKPPVGGAGKTP